MKKVKNYILSELAKKKIERYKYWCIKDENGISICSSEDNNPENKSFGEYLDKIILDNVDVEVQIKYGTNEQSSRQNPPFFIKINDSIEWVDPEQDESVTINGVPHKVDKNGHVNINLTQPSPAVPIQKIEEPKVETDYMGIFRQEMDMQLSGIRKEYELKEEKWKVDMGNQLMEQNIKFREMMLSERENRLSEKEQYLTQQEAQLDEKEKDIQDGVKSYMRQIPNALGSLVKEFIKGSDDKEESLGSTEKAEQKPPRKRNPVRFDYQSVAPQAEPEPQTDNQEDDYVEDITEYQEFEDDELEPQIQQDDEDIQD